MRQRASDDDGCRDTTRAASDATRTADTAPLHLPHPAAECPEVLHRAAAEPRLVARPARRLTAGRTRHLPRRHALGVEQRNELTRFGVPIEGFRHPAPETLESWEERLVRLFGTLSAAMCSSSRTCTRSAATSTRRPAPSPSSPPRRGREGRQPRRPAPLRRRALTSQRRSAAPGAHPALGVVVGAGVAFAAQ